MKFKSLKIEGACVEVYKLEVNDLTKKETIILFQVLVGKSKRDFCNQSVTDSTSPVI